MMKPDSINFTWIDTDHKLKDFSKDHTLQQWIAFDTEFIGERRDKTLLCLIQVSSELGIFLIDCIKINDLTPFLNLVINPDILKITHAGENDYKVLFELYRIIPVNVADVQIAAGFAGYKFPVSLAGLMSGELNRKLDKSYTVIDWEQRPLDERYILYAVEDVLFLKQIYDRLLARITKAGMESWIKQEFEFLTLRETYAGSPEKEALAAINLTQLSQKERILMLRLYQWRYDQAELTGKSKEKILPKKWINILARQLKHGKKHLLSNRSISSGFIDAQWTQLELLLNQPTTDDERELVKNATGETPTDPVHESLQDLVMSIIRYQCRLKGVDPGLVMPPHIIKLLKRKVTDASKILETTWRSDLLGDEFLKWIDFENLLSFTFEENKIIIEKNDKNKNLKH